MGTKNITVCDGCGKEEEHQHGPTVADLRKLCNCSPQLSGIPPYYGPAHSPEHRKHLEAFTKLQKEWQDNRVQWLHVHPERARQPGERTLVYCSVSCLTEHLQRNLDEAKQDSLDDTIPLGMAAVIAEVN